MKQTACQAAAFGFITNVLKMFTMKGMLFESDNSSVDWSAKNTREKSTDDEKGIRRTIGMS